MTLQQLLSPARRAIDDYDMIEDGDKIAIGLSGGKDSLLLVYIFAALKKFYRKKFDVIAVHIDMGFEDSDRAKLSEIEKVCKEQNVPFFVKKTNIAEILFDIRKESSPCSLCSKLRRGALIDMAKQEGCSKVALGHHSDDVIETFLLSLFYEGRISSFRPVTEMSRTGVPVIRPLIYAEERNIRAFMKDKPVMENACPADKHTKREYVKKLLNEIQTEIPFIREQLMSAITHPERNTLNAFLVNRAKNPAEKK